MTHVLAGFLPNDNTSWLVSCQKGGLERGQLQTAGNYKIITAVCMAKPGQFLAKCNYEITVI